MSEQLVRRMELALESDAVGVIRRAGKIYAARNLLDREDVAGFVEELNSFVVPALGADVFAVRALFLDKSSGANWALGWHQDTAVAISEKHEVAGFDAWTRKSGVWHAIAPAAVLETMLAARVHLDAVGSTDGGLSFTTGSHRQGRLAKDELAKVSASLPGAAPDIARGGVQLFRPLLVHGSSRKRSPGRRRVLHIEFASRELPVPLEWRWKVR